MTRSYQEEVDLRFNKRRYYFEDPNYRKWSDIVPFDSYGYEYLRDDALFCYYLLGHVTSSAYESEQIIEQFEKGSELPINWTSFYAYFDDIFADGASPHSYDLEMPRFINRDLKTISIKQLLEDYRGQLLGEIYDMV